MLASLDEAAAALSAGSEALDTAAALIESVNDRLRGVPGVRALLEQPGLGRSIAERLDRMQVAVSVIETALDTGTAPTQGRSLEVINAAVVRVKDGLWAVGRDRCAGSRADRAVGHRSPGGARA